MKTLEDMGISPAPWRVGVRDFSQFIYDINGAYFMFLYSARDIAANARLIAAAPKLYKALYALVKACREVGYKEFDPDSGEAEHTLYAALDEAEAAMNEAAQEPEKL